MNVVRKRKTSQKWMLPSGCAWLFQWSWSIRQWCSDQPRPSWTRTWCLGCTWGLPQSSETMQVIPCKIMQGKYSVDDLRIQLRTSTEFWKNAFFVKWTSHKEGTFLQSIFCPYFSVSQPGSTKLFKNMVQETNRQLFNKNN